MNGLHLDFLPQGGDGAGSSSLSEVLSGLVSQFGIGRKRDEDELGAFWKELVGELAQYSSVGGVRRGNLEIMVSDAIFVQELLFQKEELLKRLKERFPGSDFKDLRFRVGNAG
ncbi:MAG: DUF721 domain-containing protein [Thermoguttaceae bacterium]|nr:DUF721 domain-containing protein [Thermoguttaceae bacterium]